MENIFTVTLRVASIHSSSICTHIKLHQRTHTHTQKNEGKISQSKSKKIFFFHALILLVYRFFVPISACPITYIFFVFCCESFFFVLSSSSYNIRQSILFLFQYGFIAVLFVFVIFFFIVFFIFIFFSLCKARLMYNITKTMIINFYLSRK